MYEILAAVDQNEDRARAQAQAIADLPRDEDAVHVTLFHNFTDNPEGASVAQIAAVRRARERLESAGIDVTMAEESGETASSILDAAADVDADLVCVGGRKRSPAGKALFGSVTQAVLLDADRPVMVVGAGEA